MAKQLAWIALPVNIFCLVTPYYPAFLAKLFNLMISIGYAPLSFGQSYNVPLLKSNCNAYGKTITVDDFRGVSISPVISKIFEHCIYDRYGVFFESTDNQFGF